MIPLIVAKYQKDALEENTEKKLYPIRNTLFRSGSVTSEHSWIAQQTIC